MGVATTTAAVARPRLGRNRRRAKRAVDGVISLSLLLLLSPLFCAIALGIRVSSRGPIFFRQRRLKENGEEFTLLKFRTMCNGADRMLDEQVPGTVAQRTCRLITHETMRFHAG